MSRLLKIITTQFRELPLAEFLKLILNSVYLADPILVYACDVNEMEVNDQAGLPDFTVEKGNISELAGMGEFLKPLPWEFQCHTFDRVDDFFIARNQHGIQHISWIYYHNHHNRILSLGEDEVEIKFCLTLPAARGLGIYPRVIQAIGRYVERKGIHRIFMCVHRDNHASIRGIEKAGFKHVGNVNLRKILSFQISRRFATLEVQHSVNR